MNIDPLNLILIGATFFVSYRAFQDHSLFNKLKFNAYAIKHHKQWYRFLTHGLVHANWPHIIFNMLTMYFFGPYVFSGYEVFFGNMAIPFFLLLYIGGTVVSSVPDYFKYKDQSWYNAVGASGGVSAVLFASIVFNPWSGLRLYFLIPIPAILFAVGYLWYSAYMAKKGVDNIGHRAHLWGAIYGFVLTILLDPSLLSRFLVILLSGKS